MTPFMNLQMIRFTKTLGTETTSKIFNFFVHNFYVSFHFMLIDKGGGAHGTTEVSY